MVHIQHQLQDEHGAWSLSTGPFNLYLIRFVSCPYHSHTSLGALRSVSVGTMSDSEEESRDRQLKVVLIGDGASGKVGDFLVCREGASGQAAPAVRQPAFKY